MNFIWVAVSVLSALAVIAYVAYPFLKKPAALTDQKNADDTLKAKQNYFVKIDKLDELYKAKEIDDKTYEYQLDRIKVEFAKLLLKEDKTIKSSKKKANLEEEIEKIRDQN